MKQRSVRLAALILLVSFLFLSLLSCSTRGSKALCARWETEISDPDLGKFSMVYHFTEEGEIYLEQKKGDVIPFSIPFGTFRVEGEKLVMESDGAENVYTFSVSDTTLTLSQEGKEDLVFRKV